jgi:hypothetical protein
MVVVRVRGHRQPTPLLPERTPHPDGRMEAELQRVLALLRAVDRTEARLNDIRVQRQGLDAKASRHASRGDAHALSLVRGQADRLREERDALEAELPPLYDEIARRLADLGDDAAYLLPEPARREEP